MSDEYRQRDYNPLSMDSQFAGVLQRLGQQDDALKKILMQTTATNGRVTLVEQKLEGRWKYIMGASAGATGCAMLLWELFRHFFSR
jgi:hypothetical protein